MPQNPQDQIDELEQRIATLERIVDDQILEWATRKQNGHAKAKQRDARETLEVGDTRRVVIQESPGDSGPDAFTKIEGVATFVQPNNIPLPEGATVRVKLTDINESAAQAVPLECLDDVQEL